MDIKILSNTPYVQKELYDAFDDSNVVTDKSTDTDAVPFRKHCLKSSPTCDKSRTYFAGVDTLYADLEKKSRNSSILLSGRTKLDPEKKALPTIIKISLLLL